MGTLLLIFRAHCIVRHSLRYFRHSLHEKLPAPSVLMPCDYRILQSPPKEQVKLVLLETVERSLLFLAKLELDKYRA